MTLTASLHFLIARGAPPHALKTDGSRRSTLAVGYTQSVTKQTAVASIAERPTVARYASRGWGPATK